VAISTGPDWLLDNFIITGHRNGSIRLWSLEYDTDEYAQKTKPKRKQTVPSAPPITHKHVRPFLTVVLKETLKFHSAAVTALHTSSLDWLRVWSGDSAGGLCGWRVMAHDRWLKDTDVQCCLRCKTKFHVLERRHHCRLVVFLFVFWFFLCVLCLCVLGLCVYVCMCVPVCACVCAFVVCVLVCASVGMTNRVVW